jgi:transcriptional regulator with XRE-family HTH domain
MISFIERELRTPTFDTLRQIAAVQKISLAKLLRRAEAAAAKRGLRDS